jgi:hypothetical protein
MIAVLIIGAIVFFGLLNASRDTAAVWSAGDDGDDWMHSSFGVGGMTDNDDFLSNDDIYYSPIYSHLACNIYHDQFADDSWSSADDDFMSSSDDDWSSSSSDDDFCSCSSFDDDMGCGCSSFDDGIGCDIGCGCGWDD